MKKLSLDRWKDFAIESHSYTVEESGTGLWLSIFPSAPLSMPGCFPKLLRMPSEDKCNDTFAVVQSWMFKTWEPLLISLGWKGPWGTTWLIPPIPHRLPRSRQCVLTCAGGIAVGPFSKNLQQKSLCFLLGRKCQHPTLNFHHWMVWTSFWTAGFVSSFCGSGVAHPWKLVSLFPLPSHPLCAHRGPSRAVTGRDTSVYCAVPPWPGCCRETLTLLTLTQAFGDVRPWWKCCAHRFQLIEPRWTPGREIIGQEIGVCGTRINSRVLYPVVCLLHPTTSSFKECNTKNCLLKNCFRNPHSFPFPPFPFKLN